MDRGQVGVQRHGHSDAAIKRAIAEREGECLEPKGGRVLIDDIDDIDTSKRAAGKALCLCVVNVIHARLVKDGTKCTTQAQLQREGLEETSGNETLSWNVVRRRLNAVQNLNHRPSTYPSWS